MRKFYVTIFLSGLTCAMLSAQSISNTTWKTYNASFSDTIVVEVGTDTIKQFVGDDSLLVSSLYWQNNDTIILLDVGGPLACTNPDTGWYDIDVTSDTMIVHLINDQCIPRGVSYDGAILWKELVPTGIQDVTYEGMGLRVYPNPSSGPFTLKGQEKGLIEVYDGVGKKVNAQTIQTMNWEVQMDVEMGIYIIRFTSEGGQISQFKVIRL